MADTLQIDARNFLHEVPPDHGPFAAFTCDDERVSQRVEPSWSAIVRHDRLLEDGKIPQFEKPWRQSLNTFRTDSQIEGGEICIPPM